MLHIKAQGQSLNWFWRSFLKVFITYGRGRHLGHVTKPSCMVFFFHYIRKLPHDIWFKITQLFFEKKTKFKFENGATFVEDQIMTLTIDIHVAL